MSRCELAEVLMGGDSIAPDTGRGDIIRRDDLVDQLGEFGAQLFDRMSSEHRNNDELAILTVREARSSLSAARLPGRGAIFKSQRATADSVSSGEFVMIALSDLTEAWRASSEGFDWLEAFAVRADLPTVRRELTIRGGAPGRRVDL